MANPSENDLRDAHRHCCDRLLKAALRGPLLPRARSLSVAEAVASASRNVHGVGIGRKLVAGHPTSTRCVRVYVTQKLAPSILPPRDRIPSEIDGVVVDVIECAPPVIFARSRSRSRRSAAAIAAPGDAVMDNVAAGELACTIQRKSRIRPIVPGISAAHHSVTAGTLGCFCRSLRAGDDPESVFVLSNNHVFAHVNQAEPGDDLYQPGPADDGSAADHFADLERFIPINVGRGSQNRVDAAIGRLHTDVAFDPAICAVGRISGTIAPAEGMIVRKHGRYTGYTEGVISDIHATELVGLDSANSRMIGYFQEQIRIETLAPYPAFGLGGDSGSLVVARDSAQAVGLYFAGPPSGRYGMANPIAEVLASLEIELL